MVVACRSRLLLAPNAPRTENLDSFIAEFESLGYEVCDDCTFENGFEKVAIYVGFSGVPTHMARQLASGKWTSKLGREIDIEHHTTEGLEGNSYGKVAQALRRAIAEN